MNPIQNGTFQTRFSASYRALHGVQGVALLVELRLLIDVSDADLERPVAGVLAAVEGAHGDGGGEQTLARQLLVVQIGRRRYRPRCNT
ncbi:hypothetical protein DPMN_021376 [Dreissena polymorpha]|uniref:Uncharacterized protein n=1 Tax=Dreissena polymorpha TaxID=45954 RepID=A0A9D4NMR2_DREPO|nr:hypothetical protein DPMN_021376 [Dreissena polymorpha]